MSDRTIPPPGPFNNPAWVFGYVPTAIEWNNWFSRKADGIIGAPGTVTQIDTTGPGITGGPITMHGALAVQWNAGPTDTLGSGLVLTSGTLSVSYAATGTTTLRTAADRAHEDQINVRDYGAKLDGVHNDAPAFSAAYAAAASGPGGASIWVPRGRVNVTGATLTGGANPVLWKLDGNTFSTGTGVVSVLGDGDVTVSNYSRVSFRKQIINTPNGFATLEATITNRNPLLGGLASALRTSATMAYGARGLVSPQTINTSRSEAAANQTMLTSATTNDYSGLPPVSGQIDYGISLAFQANGPEDPSTGYNPGLGARSFLTLDPSPQQMTDVWQPIRSYSFGDTVLSVDTNFVIYRCIVPGTSGSTEPVNWPTDGGDTIVDGTVTWQAATDTLLHPWQATKTYAVGVAMQPTVRNGFTYICTVAGRSGTTEPTWPTSAGTVTDGTVTWTFGTTVAMQMSRAITIIAGSTSQIGTAFFATGPFYNAPIDLSGATLVDGGVKDAAIRIGANQPIDLSGNLTDAGQNQHTLVYRSSTQRFYYRVAGVDMWSIDASGNVRARGTITGSTTP